jgi:putative Holliday junction resolvase
MLQEKPTFAAKFRMMGRIMGIDYGTKRTGLAVTDPDRIIASPLETVPTHELMHYIADYISGEKVDMIVVGYPRKMDHTDSESLKQIRFFVAAFKKRFSGIRVEWMDERFTSKMAKDALVSAGMKKSERKVKAHVDKVSAALILQSFLERKNIST